MILFFQKNGRRNSMKLLHFINHEEGGEYIVLSNDTNPDEDYIRPGYELADSWSNDMIAEMVDKGEWEASLPTDRPLII
jgi:hypothetical protein